MCILATWVHMKQLLGWAGMQRHVSEKKFSGFPPVKFGFHLMHEKTANLVSASVAIISNEPHPNQPSTPWCKTKSGFSRKLHNPPLPQRKWLNSNSKKFIWTHFITYISWQTKHWKAAFQKELMFILKDQMFTCSTGWTTIQIFASAKIIFCREHVPWDTSHTRYLMCSK